jgi:hypothetical protein
MTDAFDELERQLRRGVRAVDDVRLLRARRGWRRTSAFALAAALTVSGGALAATQLVGGQSAETQGRKIAFQAVGDTQVLPPCLPAVASRDLVLSDGAPLPELVAELPALATPASREVQQRALAMLPRGRRGGPVLRRTVRAIPASGGVTLLVSVQQGVGVGAVRNPEGCGAARRERAAKLSVGRSDEVKRWAARRLAEMADTVPGLQTLMVMARVPGQSGMPGGGTLVRPGQPLSPGLVASGSAGRHRHVYAGIAGPQVARVLVRGGHGEKIARVPGSLPVRQGFYAVVLPEGTGPVDLHMVTASGTTLRVVKLRG